MLDLDDEVEILLIGLSDGVEYFAKGLKSLIHIASEDFCLTKLEECEGLTDVIVCGLEDVERTLRSERSVLCITECDHAICDLLIATADMDDFLQLLIDRTRLVECLDRFLITTEFALGTTDEIEVIGSTNLVAIDEMFLNALLDTFDRLLILLRVEEPLTEGAGEFQCDR